MIIDTHTHVYPEKIAKKAISKLEGRSGVKASTDGLPAGLQASMKEAGIDYSILMPVATAARQVADINKEAALTNANAQETGLFSFGGIHPDTENIKEVLRGVKDAGMKGIKLHPDYQDAYFDDIRYKRIVDAATNLGLYVMVHAGEDIGLPDPIHCRPSHVREVLRETGSDKLILAHMGGWRLWQDVEDMLVGEDVYFDTAFSIDNVPSVAGLLGESEFIHLVRAHGTKRILFGTDSPWSDQKACVSWMRACALTDAEKEDIFGGNAKGILELALMR